MDDIFSYRDPGTGPGGEQGAGLDGTVERGADEPGAGPAGAGDRPAGRGPTDASGLLTGLGVALQPNVSVRGWPADAGSRALDGFTAVEDATVVRRLKQAGATICGSTRMSEFGLGLTGSLAGEAVRRRAADVELVLDFMGESRLAAARAVVCGFKPSYGLVSRAGLIGLIPSMESCGVLARDPARIGEVLQAVAGQDGLDFSLPEVDTPDFSPHKVDPSAITLGVVAEARDTLPDAQAEAFRASLATLKGAGFALRELSLPDWPLFPLVHRVVGSVEASSATGRYDSVRYGPRAPGAKNWNDMYLLSRGAAFGSLLKSYIIQGAFFQFERYEAFEDACRVRARLVKQMEALASHADFLVFPAGNGHPTGGLPTGGGHPAGDAAAHAGGPPSLTDLYAQFASTLFANVTGQPVFCLPPPPDESRPAIQLVGRRLSDARLLALGAFLLHAVEGGE